jgi:hypothetical protein
MTGFSPAGSPVTTHIVFNSGTIDFGNERLVMLDNVVVGLEYSLSPLYVLGSIKPQNYARHTQKITLGGKLKSAAPSLMAMVAGSSSGASPTNILTLDGQPTLLNPIVTFYDAVGNEFQYQLSNAIFKSTKHSARMEDYSEFDFEMEASDITILSTTAL